MQQEERQLRLAERSTHDLSPDSCTWVPSTTKWGWTSQGHHRIIVHAGPRVTNSPLLPHPPPTSALYFIVVRARQPLLLPRGGQSGHTQTSRRPTRGRRSIIALQPPLRHDAYWVATRQSRRDECCITSRFGASIGHVDILADQLTCYGLCDDKAVKPDSTSAPGRGVPIPNYPRFLRVDPAVDWWFETYPIQMAARMHGSRTSELLATSRCRDSPPQGAKDD